MFCWCSTKRMIWVWIQNRLKSNCFEFVHDNLTPRNRLNRSDWKQESIRSRTHIDDIRDRNERVQSTLVMLVMVAQSSFFFSVECCKYSECVALLLFGFCWFGWLLVWWVGGTKKWLHRLRPFVCVVCAASECECVHVASATSAGSTQ
jgi:hypothetical protein